jgi:hypothetical protein
MISPNLERYVEQLAVEIRKECSEAATISDFQLKSMILDKIQEHAEAEADALLAVATMTAIVKSLSELSRLLPKTFAGAQRY